MLRLLNRLRHFTILQFQLAGLHLAKYEMLYL